MKPKLKSMMMTGNLSSTFTYFELNFRSIVSKVKKRKGTKYSNELTGNFLGSCSLIRPITLPKDQSSFLRFFQVTKLTK